MQGELSQDHHIFILEFKKSTLTRVAYFLYTFLHDLISESWILISVAPISQDRMAACDVNVRAKFRELLAYLLKSWKVKTQIRTSMMIS